MWRKGVLSFAVTVSVVAAPILAGAQDSHADHDMGGGQPAASATYNEKIPAPEEHVAADLKKSPRHHEYVDVKMDGVAIKTFVAYPERKDKAPVVIVIHENRGLSEWIRGVADQLAEDGFIALAPDLLSGKGPDGGGTDAIGSQDEVIKVLRTVTPDDVVTRLNAVRDYGIKLPAANGRSATVGFCWGGGQSFNSATAQPALNAAVVFYGASPETPKLAGVKAPVLGLYGGDDARVNATIEPAAAELQKMGKTYEREVYDGAAHAFLRGQLQRDANLKAAQQAWPRAVTFLRKHLS